MPPKRRSGAKRRPLDWVPAPNGTELLVPGYQLQDDELISGRQVVSLNKKTGVLQAMVCKVSEGLVTDSIPKRADFIYLHPCTQRTCGFTIGEPTLLFSSSSVTVTVPWPISKVHLDNVAVGPMTRTNCQVNVGDMVCIRKLQCSVLPADYVHLVSIAETEVPQDKVFIDYMKHHLDGRVLIPGNAVQVVYYGIARRFTVCRLRGSRGEINAKQHKQTGCIQVETSTPVGLDDDTQLSESMVSLQLSDSESHHSVSLISSPLEIVEIMEQKDTMQLCDAREVPIPHFEFVYKITLQSELVVEQKDTSMRHVTNDQAIEPITYSCIGGMEKQIREVRELIELPLKAPHLFSASGLSPPRGVLLYGLPGTGKTLLARAAMFECKAHVVSISAAEVMCRYYGETEAKLRDMFRCACSRAPSIIFIDELDAVCPKRDVVASEFEKRVVATLVTLLDEIPKTSSAPVVVIGATNRLEAVDTALRRPGRFDREIEMTIPTAKQRAQILSVLLQSVSHILCQADIASVADAAHGHVGADLSAVCREAGSRALQRCLEGVDLNAIDSSCSLNSNICVTVDDLKFGLKKVRPSAMRQVIVDVPKVQWSDVGGQECIKQQLKEAVEWPLKHHESFVHLGIQPPRGILLYGPPGCSKTLIAKALATESGLNFISVKGPELFSQWVGESEKAVRQVFKKARQAAPAVVFFDEIDALATHRGSEESSVGDRVLSQLLTEMDGIEQLQDVTVLAATNRPDMIDKALMRPGRLDYVVYVPLPDEATRKAIFEIQFRHIPVSSEVDAKRLASSTKGFSGAEVVAVCREAALCALRENIDSRQVTAAHFHQALSVVKPQTSSTAIQKYEEFARTGGVLSF